MYTILYFSTWRNQTNRTRNENRARNFVRRACVLCSQRESKDFSRATQTVSSNKHEEESSRDDFHLTDNNNYAFGVFGHLFQNLNAHIWRTYAIDNDGFRPFRHNVNWLHDNSLVPRDA